MELISWNVNGIRAAYKKGFMDWLRDTQPDIVALQETRVLEEQLPKDLKNLQEDGYHAYWVSAEKKGYSGVSIFSKTEPLDITVGLGDDKFDSEGRTIIAEYDQFFLMNGYFPSGSRDLSRVDYKVEYNDAFFEVARKYSQQKPVIFCGDLNIAHTDIDLARPKSNKNNSGCLPEERAFIDKSIEHGFVDTWRHLNPEVEEVYSWWTARGTAREKNVGWRIDYFFMANDLLPALVDANIYTDVLGSDHCPVGVTLDLDKL